MFPTMRDKGGTLSVCEAAKHQQHVREEMCLPEL